MIVKSERSCEGGLFCLDDMMNMSHDVGYSHVTGGCFIIKDFSLVEVSSYNTAARCFLYAEEKQEYIFPCLQSVAHNWVAVKEMMSCSPQIGLLIFKLLIMDEGAYFLIN